MRQLQALEKEGVIDLFYGDESGFCLTPAIPYGWQLPGEHVATQPRHRQRFNVLGLFNATTNALHTAAREGTLGAAFVIDTLDAWVATRTHPTVLVLDNARLHHAATFQARLQDWEDRDAPIFYRPTAPTSPKSRPAGVKSNTSGCGPKPTPIPKLLNPLFGTSPTALACNSPSHLQPDIIAINLNKHLTSY